MLYWNLSYTDFLDEIEVQNTIDDFDSIANVWQVGVALGKRDERVKIWLLSFDRLGLAYNFGTTNSLRGVKFIFRSFYDL